VHYYGAELYLVCWWAGCNLVNCLLRNGGKGHGLESLVF
jgi:hypothetical protein